MDTYVISWRPQNFITVGLMLAGWALIYVVAMQIARRVNPKAA